MRLISQFGQHLEMDKEKHNAVNKSEALKLSYKIHSSNMNKWTNAMETIRKILTERTPSTANNHMHLFRQFVRISKLVVRCEGFKECSQLVGWFSGVGHKEAVVRDGDFKRWATGIDGKRPPMQMCRSLPCIWAPWELDWSPSITRNWMWANDDVTHSMVEVRVSVCHTWPFVCWWIQSVNLMTRV